MTNSLTAHPASHQTTCEICGNTIHHPDTLLIADPAYPICRSFECRNMLRQKSSMTPALFKTQIEFKRKINAERLAREAIQKKRVEEVTLKERDEHRHILQTVLQNNPELTKNNIHLLVIPSGLSRLVPPSTERLSDYTQHLNNIIRKAAEHTDASDVVHDQHYIAHERLHKLEQTFAENPALHTISDRLCTMCRGGCCASGKDHAYLSVITMRRYMDKHPALTHDDIRDLYLSHVATETIDDACINQTATGCRLPRELRSDICNEYYCDPIKSYQKKQTGKTDMDIVLAIQRANTHWNRFDLNVCNDITNVALVDETKTQMLGKP